MNAQLQNYDSSFLKRISELTTAGFNRLLGFFGRILGSQALPTVLFVLSFLVYFLSSTLVDNHYYHTHTANSFLHGRLDFLENVGHEMVEFKDKLYSVHPPLPALMLTPFVYVFGVSCVSQILLTIFFAAMSVSICFKFALHFYQSKELALWIAILYGFGTIVWFHTEVGSVWYSSQIIGLAFVWVALYFGIAKERYFLSGLFFACAYLSRIPSVLNGVIVCFWIVLQLRDGLSYKTILHRFALLAAGLAPGLLVLGIYNFLRFETVMNVGYDIMVKADPLYPNGQFSISYVWPRLKDMMLLGPFFQTTPPFVKPSNYMMAVWITTPAFFFILRAKFFDLKIFVIALSCIIVALPGMMHGGNGYTQFGYRHTLDYMPALILLTASGISLQISMFAKILIVLSVLINFWGVLMNTWFDQAVFGSNSLIEVIQRVISP